MDEGCVDVIAVDEQTGDINIMDEGYVDVIVVDEQTVDKRILEEWVIDKKNHRVATLRAEPSSSYMNMPLHHAFFFPYMVITRERIDF